MAKYTKEEQDNAREIMAYMINKYLGWPKERLVGCSIEEEEYMPGMSGMVLEFDPHLNEQEQTDCKNLITQISRTLGEGQDPIFPAKA